MNNAKFHLSESLEIKKREGLVREFVRKVIGHEEVPFFISDGATVFDLTSESEVNLQEKILSTYAVSVQKENLSLKLWQLIDLIFEKMNKKPC